VFTRKIDTSLRRGDLVDLYRVAAQNRGQFLKRHAFDASSQHLCIYVFHMPSRSPPTTSAAQPVIDTVFESA